MEVRTTEPHDPIVAHTGSRYFKLDRSAVIAMIAIGFALRLWQYLARPSIWVDEAAVARNVLDRGLLDLFGPLDYGQVLPPGFLLLVKMSAMLFGPSEFSLRLVPIVSGLASVVLFYILAMRWLRRPAALSATALFATASPLVMFSSNLKQYSSDVLATVIALLLIERLRERPVGRRDIVLYSAIGVALIVMSQAVVFVLAAGGALMAIECLSRKPFSPARLSVVSSWGIASLAAIVWGRHLMTPVALAYLKKYWAGSFMPLTPSLAPSWLWQKVNALVSSQNLGAFDGSLHYGLTPALSILLVLSIPAAVWRWRARSILVLAPIGFTIAASAARSYPFEGRLLLFLLPIVFLLLASLVSDIGRMASRDHGEWLQLVLVGVAVVAVMRDLPPRRPEHLRPVMEYLQTHFREGDRIFVYYGAGPAFEYYRNLFPLKGEPVIGACRRGAVQLYTHDLDHLRGQPRVWVVMAHAKANGGGNERDTIIFKYLDMIGTRLDSKAGNPSDVTASAASVVLYNLSDSQKLNTVSADTFQVPASNNARSQAWSCYGPLSPVPGRNRPALER